MNELVSHFHDQVALKYSLYNSLFLTLPFKQMREIGALLTVFSKDAAEKIKLGKHPRDIVEQFFKKNINPHSPEEKISTLFTMLQFVERQVVLFDALEDAAYAQTHRLDGAGTLVNLINKTIHFNHQPAFIKEVENYRIKLVLTAHPTQFYPYPVLGIITQLTAAIQNNDLKAISDTLWQMGKTSFKHAQPPTPIQEAQSLIWYVENIFYQVIPQIHLQIYKALKEFHHAKPLQHPVIELGFWPGGDRDGNPNINAEITLAVAKLLKNHALKLYAADLRRLAKKLTFKGILEKLQEMRHKVENIIYHSANELLEDLLALRHELVIQHESLFIETLDEMIFKVQCFGFHLAGMDMRENSSIHTGVVSQLIKNYSQLNETAKNTKLIDLIENHKTSAKKFKNADAQFQRTWQSIAAINMIQNSNGEKALCRYIISNTHSVVNILEVFALLKIAGNFADSIPVDIVPLFESIEDLENCSAIMQKLYQTHVYKKHLAERHNIQTVMLGFSDGTKDGGYVCANWSIYKAKMQLTQVSKQNDIQIIFFDGRGGPPARGGGNTHDFYRSLGVQISHRDLQLTVQGQTISSNFGTPASAKFNIEQFYTAGIDDLIFPESAHSLSPDDADLLQKLADESRKIYSALKADPLFVPYLVEMTPLKFYGELNISSRPMARAPSSHLQFEQLRAIPFVGAWSQLKQNIPGYYGFGSALQAFIKDGKELSLKKLYQHSFFFRTLVENTMMSLCKTFFPLTAYMRKDKKFGRFWRKLHNEAKLTQILLEKISGQNCLLENDPLNRESIKLREEIVLPLLVIQQYAISELKKCEPHSELAEIYKQIILKSLAANTNASRNAA